MLFFLNRGILEIVIGTVLDFQVAVRADTLV